MIPFRRTRLSLGLGYEGFGNIESITQDVEAYIKDSKDFVCDFESEGEGRHTLLNLIVHRSKSIAILFQTKTKSIVQRHGSRIAYNTIRTINENKEKI